LQRWVYPAVSVLLLCTFLTRLPLAPAARYQVATVAGITVLAYIAVVYFICYLVFTPLDAVFRSHSFAGGNRGSQRWSIAPRTSGSARRWRSLPPYSLAAQALRRS
jgi:hypothetical protein